MGSYTLSGKADSDLMGIARDSIKQWGMAQAEHYILALHETFQRLAEFPGMGRDAGAIRPGYLRMEAARHVVFYRTTASGILIVRVLHERMDFGRHFDG